MSVRSALWSRPPFLRARNAPMRWAAVALPATSAVEPYEVPIRNRNCPGFGPTLQWRKADAQDAQGVLCQLPGAAGTPRVPGVLLY
jgi:hypothetical protein